MHRCRIDFHAHLIVDLPDFANRYGDPRWPTFSQRDGVGQLSRDGHGVRSLPPAAWSPARRIEELDAAGLERQVLSPIPPLVCDWGESGPATEWADHLNREVAEVVRTNPERFSGLGTVPLHHPDHAVAVLQRAHEAGLVGVEIGTDAGERELDHPDLREFFAASEELGMIIFVHPLLVNAVPKWSSRISGLANRFGLTMGTDTAIAASRLVFGGPTRDNPNLRICLAHGGGTFFWALSRIALLWDRSEDVPSVDLIRNVYADSVVYDPINLRYLCERIGAERVLFGTDYPLPAQDDLNGTILAGVSTAEAELIAGVNAARLLGLPERSA